MGRAFPRMKRTCHIRVSVSQLKEDGKSKKAAAAETPAEPVEANESQSGGDE